MFDKVNSKNVFKLKYSLDRYKTQEMRGKAADACLPALLLIGMLRIKWLTNLIMLYFQLVIYFSMILILSHFSEIIWVLIL